MKVFVSILFILGSLLVSSCGNEPERVPSILLITIDNLGFEDLSCTGLMSSQLEGFKKICEDSVYFTHAYSPSVLTKSAVSSLLTGQSPPAHKLRGLDDYLSEAIVTLPEKIVKKGVRTAFFSGGGALWRKSGLDQGFEVFDDNIPIRWNRLYRESETTVNLFLSWLQKKRKKESFFSVLHFIDLYFKNRPTFSESGQERVRGRQGQILELSDSLLKLYTSLKQQDRWNNTMVILVGLNGVSRRDGEVKAMNLFSENTHIPLVIKPAKKKRDLGIRWTIDKNISLIDLGYSLFEFYNLEPPKPQQGARVSLLKSLEKPISNWDNERPLIMESQWKSLTGQVSRRQAIRRGRRLYINDEQPKLYNSLLDRQERSEIAPENSLFSDFMQSLREIDSLLMKPWQQTEDSVIFLNQFVNHYWMSSEQSEDWPISLLLSEASKSPIFANLLSELLIQNRMWEELLESSHENKNKVDEYIALTYLNQDKFKTKQEEFVEQLDDHCIKSVLRRQRSTFIKHCTDDLSIAFWAWYTEEVPKKKKRKFGVLYREYNFLRLQEKINIYNYAYGYPWFYFDQKNFTKHWLDRLIHLPMFKKLKENIGYNQRSMKI